MLARSSELMGISHDVATPSWHFDTTWWLRPEHMLVDPRVRRCMVGEGYAAYVAVLYHEEAEELLYRNLWLGKAIAETEPQRAMLREIEKNITVGVDRTLWLILSIFEFEADVGNAA